MAVTRDPDFSAEAAQLFQSFNRCSEGHNPLDVLTAAMNFLVLALIYNAQDTGLSKAQAVEYAEGITDQVVADVGWQWDRRPEPTDVVVPMGS